MPIPNINLAQVSGLRKNSSETPRISTREGMLNGARGVITPGSLIFQDNFDAQDLWSGEDTGGIGSAWAEDGATIPTGWDAARTSGNYAEITADPEKTRNGTGKAFVARRKSRTDAVWTGDSILAKTFENQKELFIRFWIKFQPGWTPVGGTKIFRVQAWRNRDKNDAWNSSFISPTMLWNGSYSNFGSRNKISIRTHRGGLNNPEIQGLPRNHTNGDLSNSWGPNSFDLNGDGVVDNNPEIPNLVEGGFIPNDIDFESTHERIFGTEWRKLEFHVKMNSAPGVQDGVLTQWFMDQVTFKNEQMAWIQNDGDPSACWDIVKIGGNDTFPMSEAGITEWYAIDDLEIWNGLPEDKIE